MAHKPWISHDDAKRLIIKWHLMGLQWVPPQEISYDEGPGEEIIEVQASEDDLETG
jgi:hypothetical protein